MNLSSFLEDWPIPTISALGTAFVAISAALITRYSKPNIQYRTFGDSHAYWKMTFLIRSFEPESLSRSLCLRVKGVGDNPVEIVAGPWLGQVQRSGNDVIVELKGFPAEGIVGIRAAAECELERVEDRKGDLEPRRFGEMEHPFNPRKAFAARLIGGFLLGVITYLLACAFMYKIARPYFGASPGWIDLVFLGVLLPLSFGAFALAVPRTGKDTFPGVIDWELAVRPAPAAP